MCEGCITRRFHIKLQVETLRIVYTVSAGLLQLSTFEPNTNKLQVLFQPEDKVGGNQRTGKTLRLSWPNKLNADTGTVFD